MYRIRGLHSWMAGLGDDLRAQVMALGTQRQYDEGDFIWRQGDRADTCFRIIDGRVRLCNYTATGNEVIMGEFRSGDCFGESSLLEALPRFNHAYALGTALLQVISREQFMDAYDRYPEIARALNLMLARRLRLVYGTAEDAAGLSLRERIARLLLRLATSVAVDEDGAIVIDRVSHETFAQMLGASRQAVSRELKQLERDGFLCISYGRITMLDMNRLAGEFASLISDETIVPDYAPAPER